MQSECNFGFNSFFHIPTKISMELTQFLKKNASKSFEGFCQFGIYFAIFLLFMASLKVWDHQRLDWDHSDHKLKLRTVEFSAASHCTMKKSFKNCSHLLIFSIYKPLFSFDCCVKLKLKQKKETKLKEIKPKMFIQCTLKDRL